LPSGINAAYPDVKTSVQSSIDYGIAEGRNALLKTVKTPLMAYVDDDCSFGGRPVFPDLEASLKSAPLALVGIPSYRDGTEEIFKPRKETPRVVIDGTTYMKVEGMFGASYTRLLRDVGGFNERKKFRLEWTDLNMRLWRSGYATGMLMNSGHLRQWFDAPDSATRNLDSRAQHIIYGDLATHLEFKGDLSAKSIKHRAERLRHKFNGTAQDASVAVSRVFSDLSEIKKYRTHILTLPFNSGPKSRKDWLTLSQFSSKAISAYRNDL
jgi:hypothetical protein